MPRPLYLIFIAALANVTLTMGSLQAQTLPRVGQVLWEIRYDGFGPNGGIAYAEDTGLLFAGASGRVLVVRGATGEVLDTIYTSTEEWRIHPDVRPMRDVVDISCSRDGKVLCLTVSIGSNSKTVIMDYPSKRIIKDNLYVGRRDEWTNMRVKVSPMGRYVVAPDTTRSLTAPGQFQIRLFDLLQDTSYVIDGGAWARCDFDDAERHMVFVSRGSIGTAMCGNRVSIATLGDGAPVIKHTQEYGWPAISGDGRYVMSSGYGLAIGFSPYPTAIPRARVIETETGNVVWSVNGDFSGGDNGVTGYNEFERPVWSRDASRLYCIRNSKKIPVDWRARIFYNTTDTVPSFRIADSCRYIGSRSTESSGSTSNSQLTIGFTSGRGGYLRAESLVPTTSTVDDDRGPAERTTVYPNPTNAMSTIQYTLEKSGHVIVDVIDVHGAVVVTLEDDHADAGTHTVDLSSASITSGTYVVRVRQGSMMYTSLVVVRH